MGIRQPHGIYTHICLFIFFPFRRKLGGKGKPPDALRFGIRGGAGRAPSTAPHNRPPRIDTYRSISRIMKKGKRKKKENYCSSIFSPTGIHQQILSYKRVVDSNVFFAPPPPHPCKQTRGVCTGKKNSKITKITLRSLPNVYLNFAYPFATGISFYINKQIGMSMHFLSDDQKFVATFCTNTK